MFRPLLDTGSIEVRAHDEIPSTSGYKKELLQNPDLHHAFGYPLHQRSSLPNIGFPCSLTTNEMTLYVLGKFERYRKEVVFPPHQLPSDYEELCPDFILAVAEEYAQDCEVPELPQAVFLAMLLNDTMKLGVLRGWMIGVMKSALKELRWSAF
ncbi:hypothetical protein Cgig2_028486 [Carnegiea gigantea]|uniref:Uncharacterized protein n=1 Tax=Carnegiea gigantea TaxID=171969 RepID=A0A9Q1GG10_9CARY|nr:hypothetical protein Cgig2_028486 [Carnegiea gigantea]